MELLKLRDLVRFAAAAPIMILGTTASAQTEAALPAAGKGDAAWMLTATALVLLMTVPGLALFYGGLVRAKNMLSVLMQVLYSLAVMSVIWIAYGYSLAFTDGGSLNAVIGGLDKAFLAGVGPESLVETFTKGVFIPEYAFIAFQLTFAAITPALIVGATAERIRFPAIALFLPLWATVVYLPVAHMVWYWGGPSAFGAPSGLLFGMGALDFAGGTVVHINAGIAGLVGALMVGHRIGYRHEPIMPHSLSMTLIGAGLLWVGWIGFNAGSALEASGVAALATVNTIAATGAAALAWLVAECMGGHKPSLLGAITGVVAGLVAITPAAGLSSPGGALLLGAGASAVCYAGCTVLKNRFGYDDSLDVFGVHGIGGIVGAIGTGIVAAPSLGGAGVLDYAAGTIADYSISGQILIQTKAVLVTVLWSGVGSAALFRLVDALIGLRAAHEEEREGLDVTYHGERAYNV
jgi:Amt family ammonium transporter